MSGESVISSGDDIVSDSEDGDNSLLGDARNESRETPARGHHGNRKRRGRKRGPRSMGRYPFVTVSKRYLEDLKPYRAKLTIDQLRRDLRVVGRDLLELRQQEKIPTTNPEKLGEKDIGAIIHYWRTRESRYGKPLDPTSQAHLFKALKGLLEWCGNNALLRMKRLKHVRFPKPVEKPIRVLRESDLVRIRQAAEAIEGWRGSVARFIVTLMPYSGLRPKEMRLAKLDDVDVANWRILVSRPKGEGTWAAPDYAPILPPARESVMDFLAERAKMLRGFDLNPGVVEPLVPYVRASGKADYWPAAMLRKLKADIQEVAGVEFQLRTFRPTFAQNLKDRGADIESVSRALRHKTTKTTELFYARIRSEKAFRELESLYEMPEVKVAD